MRLRRIVAQHGADFSYRAVDATIDVYEDVFAPQFVDDLLARDQFAPPLDEEDEKVHRLAFEFDPFAVYGEFVAVEVNAELAGLSLQRHGGVSITRIFMQTLSAFVSIDYTSHGKVRQKSSRLH